MPKAKLRVYWIPALGMNDQFHVEVNTFSEAQLLLSSLADYDLFLNLHNMKPEYSNTGGLEIFEGNEWVEWDDPQDANSIEEISSDRLEELDAQR